MKNEKEMGGKITKEVNFGLYWVSCKFYFLKTDNKGTFSNRTANGTGQDLVVL